MKKLLVFTTLILAILFTIGQAQAAIIDLGTSTEGTINGAIFQYGWSGNSSGTGVFDPFVRIQDKVDEDGYNTSGSVMPDVKTGLHTHDIRLDAISTILVNDTLYREFLLDRGEKDDSISLDKVSIYLRNAALVDGSTLANLTSSGANLIYNLDVGIDGESSVWLTRTDSGNGKADMTMYVPNYLFGSGNPYVYLYSKFGTIADTAPSAYSLSSDASFEEWGVRYPAVHQQATPEPTSLSLLGLGLLGLMGFKRKRGIKA